MTRAAGGEGALRRTAGRTVAIPARLARNPSVLGEVGRKVWSRLTSRRHIGRTGLYRELAVPAMDGLGLVLGRPSEDVQAAAERLSFQELMTGLASRSVPSAARAIGGAAFLEATYASVRVLRPAVVVETGVGLGYSTAVILMALEENGAGSLTSLDLPVFRPGAPAYTGDAIPGTLRSSRRWSLVVGPDRRTLPRVLPALPPVDLALYDSDKSYEGMVRGLGELWRHLRRGGVLVVDDVDGHDGFLDFADAVGQRPTVIPKPWGTPLYGRPGAFVGLVRKPEESE